MSIIKWTVPISYGDKPVKREYARETEHFYVRADKRRDSKSSSYERYFDSEQEALDFIRQRNENKAEKKRVDQIKRHAVELLGALIAAEAKLVIAEHHLDRGEDDSITFEPEILAARAAIAKAKGEA